MERFLVNLIEKCADFLRPKASVSTAGLGLLVGIWRDRWRGVSRSLEGSLVKGEDA